VVVVVVVVAAAVVAATVVVVAVIIVAVVVAAAVILVMVVELTTCFLSSPLYPPSLWLCGPTQAMASSFLRFLDHIQRCITVGRTPLDM